MQRSTPDDLFHHRTVTGLNGSRAHGRLVFKVGRALRGSDDYERSAWSIGWGDDAPRAWTSTEFNALSPCWSRDGDVLAFLSSRGDAGAQVHLLRTQGGEAERLTNAKEKLASIEAWSHDGKRLLVSASRGWDEDGDPRPKGGGRAPKVVTYLPYKRDGAGITVGERTHLYVADIDSGALTAVTGGDFDVVTGAWSEDGGRLAYVRHRGGRERQRTDLWLADRDGARARRRVEGIASISRIAWSPDGRYIAFSGTQEEGDSMVNLWLLRVDGDEAPRRLGGEDFELEPLGGLAWHAAGRRVAVVCAHRGVSRLALVSVDDGRVQRIDRGLHGVTGCTAWGGRIAFVSASMRRLEEVHSIDWNGGDERRHSNLNRWFRSRVRPHVSRRSFRVPDGDGGSETIRAWILRPRRGKAPHPVLADMHGGPHSTVLIDYASHTYWYALLEAGWMIVAPDAVGSASYGKDFARRLRGRWGELDLPQYEAVVRALQREGLASDCVACAGTSYGGFLAAWAVGHSDLFCAAAVCAPVSNMLSHFGTSDTGHYATPWMLGAEFPDDRARWHAQSAVEHLRGATTPTLILQGESDGRCPRGQGEEVFAHLIRYSDAPVEMVVYPGGTHGVAEGGLPTSRLDYHGRICTWLVRWAGARERGTQEGGAGQRKRA